MISRFPAAVFTVYLWAVRAFQMPARVRACMRVYQRRERNEAPDYFPIRILSNFYRRDDEMSVVYSEK